MYTTKRYKRAHSVLNLKVLNSCLARGMIFENVVFLRDKKNPSVLRTLCADLYLFVVYILFVPVISTSIHRCVNNYPDIKVLTEVI